MQGEKFGRLTVVEFAYKDNRSRLWWKCTCDCGTEKVLHTGNLRSGNTKSCGCLSLERKKATRISKHHSDVTAVIAGYKRHATRRGHVWELTRAQVETIIQEPCHYCGMLGSNTKVTKNSIEPFKYNGIDRKHNESGYTVDNTVACCRVCNRAKLNMGYEDFLNWIKAMAEQWSKYIES